MPLTTLSINTQENHCVRHSKGSYQSREISHTDIHSHARTHVRDSMHCFGKFWSHNTSIFSSTSCNWQPRFTPQGIVQGHLKWERRVGKERKRKHTLRFSNVSRVDAAVLWKAYVYLKAYSKWKQQCQAELQIIKHNYSRNLPTSPQATVSLKRKIDSWAAG